MSKRLDNIHPRRGAAGGSRWAFREIEEARH